MSTASTARTAHDVHTHGNCSWSGVYTVQIDPPEERAQHPVYSAATRLYGPHFTTLGGARHESSEQVADRPVLTRAWAGRRPWTPASYLDHDGYTRWPRREACRRVR